MNYAERLAAGMGYLTIKEVDAIKMIVMTLPPNPVCVNIGSGAGTSSIAVLEERADALVVDIDIDATNGLAQVREAGYLDGGRYERLTGDSKLIAWPWRCDYLFVDGDHSDPGVRGDLAAWLPRLNPGGYVLLHDYWPYPPDHELAGRDYWPDVKKVAEEVMQPYTVIFDIDRIRAYRLPEKEQAIT